MNSIQTIADKTAIGLSLACTLHCVALPLLVVSLPAATALNLTDEAFHLWMLIAVIPISLFSLTMGCKKHKNYSVMLLGLAGLGVLISTVWLGHDILGETGEKAFTVLGACLVAAGHILNHRLCQQSICQCRT